MTRSHYVATATLGLASVTLVMVAAQAPAPPPGAFTAEQAAAGRVAYETTCSGCHGGQLAGPPPLAGAAFTNGWGARPVRDLLTAVQSMPPDQPGGLTEPTYLAITAFILQFNGAGAGPQPLTATATAPIGHLLRGGIAQAGAPQAAAPAGRGAAPPAQAQAGAAGRGRGQAAPPVTGLTVAGVVRNYTRVTDDMLRNPPASDWPMLRRDQAPRTSAR